MKRGPWEPIFKVDLKRGLVNIGNTPAAPLPPPAPTTLQMVGTVTDALLDRVDRVIVDGAYCYLTSAPNDRLIVCDVSNPAAPAVIGSRTNSTNLNVAADLAKSGDYVYVTVPVGNRLTSNDVSTPSAPTLGSSLANANFANAKGLAIVGTHAFVIARPSSVDTLVAVDISNPLSMSVVGTVTHANFAIANRLRAEGNYAYVIGDSSTDAVTIVDISNPASMSVVGTVSDSTNLNNPLDLHLDGDTVYVSGLTSVDVTNRAAPAVLDTLAITGNESAFCKIGNFLFVASDTSNKVEAIEVSDPSVMASIASLTDAANLAGVSGLATDGTYIYCAAFTADRLTILEFV